MKQLIPAALLLSACSTVAEPQADWALILHGGAGNIPAAERTPERQALYQADLDAAMDAGTAVLRAGGDALDAVEAAIVILEDSPQFNAGRGAVFTNAETNELDASVMVGSTRDAGAVAGVTRTKNPIRLARTVMEDSPHVMMAGAGADTYSREQGLEQASPEWFRTERRLQSLRRAQARASADLPRPTMPNSAPSARSRWTCRASWSREPPRAA